MMEIDPLRFRLNLHAAKAGGVHLFSHSLGSGRLIVDYQVHVESAEAQTATCCHVAVPFKDSESSDAYACPTACAFACRSAIIAPIILMPSRSSTSFLSLSGMPRPSVSKFFSILASFLVYR